MYRETIAVVIAVRNRAAYVTQTLDTVAAQTRLPDEIVVVDDGSEDGTAEVVERWRRRHRLPLRLIRQNHAGATVAGNRGVRASSASLVAVLDSDDLCHPRRLEIQERMFAQRPELVLVGSSLECIDAQGRSLGFRREAPDDSSLQLRLLFKCPIAHPAAMFRRSVWEQVGGYDERVCYAHDYELFSRMARHGQLANAVETLLRYRVHRHSITSRHRIHQLAVVRQVSLDNLLADGLARCPQEAMLLRLLVGVEKYAFPVPELDRTRLLHLADRLASRFRRASDPRLRRWARRAYRNALRFSRQTAPRFPRNLPQLWRGIQGAIAPYRVAKPGAAAAVETDCPLPQGPSGPRFSRESGPECQKARQPRPAGFVFGQTALDFFFRARLSRAPWCKRS